MPPEQEKNNAQQVVNNLSQDDGNLQSENDLVPELDKNITILTDRLNSANSEFRDLKKDFVTMFGIFASFVTFLSVEIQVFKTVDSFWLIFGLSSFLLAGMLLFALTLNNLTKDKNEWKDFWSPSFVLILIFLIVSVFSFSHYSNEQKKEEPNETITLPDFL